VAGAQAKVAVQGQGRLATEWHGSFAATVAEDDYDLVVEVQVVGEHDAARFQDANTRVDEQPDDRRIPPGGEVTDVGTLDLVHS
jgi:hypothetical protein